MTTIKRFSENTEGKDYVVGDIHGAYDKLMMALTLKGFDQDKDRLFSVGDLIDRGGESEKCLRLTEEPWFHAVRGNHEDFLKQAWEDNEVRVWYANGGTWWSDIYHEVKAELYDMVMEMPLVIEIERGGKLYGIAHGDFPRDFKDWKNIESGVEKNSYFVDTMLWGRTRANRGCQPDAIKAEDIIEGIEKVYMGHTPYSPITFPKGMHCGNIEFLDTGAWWDVSRFRIVEIGE